jgi:hypothetical protein
MPQGWRHINPGRHCPTQIRPQRPSRRPAQYLGERDGPLGIACTRIAELANDLAIVARRNPTPRAIRAAVSGEHAAMALHAFNAVLADLIAPPDDDQEVAA